MTTRPTPLIAKYRPLVIGTCVLLALGAFVALRFEVTTDLYAFLPEADDRELGALSHQIAQSELSRTMIFALSAPDADTAVRASRAFESALRQETSVAPEIAALEGGPAEGVERGLFELYEPRRFGFLAPDAPQARARIADAGLTRAAVELRTALASPMAPMLSRVAPRDPFQIVPGLFQGLRGSAANDLTVRDGRFIASDQRTAVLFLSTRSSAFDADVQAPVIAGIGRAFARVDRSFDGTLELDQSGLNRFATRAATAIKGDIQRVSTLSMLLIGAMLFGLFRSFRLLALASIPVGAGVLAGSFVVLLLFGRVHGITMAFGASLIGLSVDYVVHVYCFHALHAGLLGAGSLVALGAPRGGVLLRERHVRRVPRHALHAARAHAGHVSPGGAALACGGRAGPRLRRAPHAAALAVGLSCGHRRVRGGRPAARALERRLRQPRAPRSGHLRRRRARPQQGGPLRANALRGRAGRHRGASAAGERARACGAAAG
jgi:predicted exporter